MKIFTSSGFFLSSGSKNLEKIRSLDQSGVGTERAGIEQNAFSKSDRAWKVKQSRLRGLLRRSRVRSVMIKIKRPKSRKKLKSI